jgi:hypothetical protein
VIALGILFGIVVVLTAWASWLGRGAGDRQRDPWLMARDLRNTRGVIRAISHERCLVSHRPWTQPPRR